MCGWVDNSLPAAAVLLHLFFNFLTDFFARARRRVEGGGGQSGCRHKAQALLGALARLAAAHARRSPHGKFGQLKRKVGGRPAYRRDTAQSWTWVALTSVTVLCAEVPVVFAQQPKKTTEKCKRRRIYRLLRIVLLPT